MWAFALGNDSSGICYFYVKHRGKTEITWKMQEILSLLECANPDHSLQKHFHFDLNVVGAAAAVSALAQPKAGSVATAMLRANQPGTVQLSSPTSSTAAHVGPVGGLHAMQQRALIPVRPSNPATPPATRSVSPAVTTVLHNQTDPHRYCTVMSGKEIDSQENGVILCCTEMNK